MPRAAVKETLLLVNILRWLQEKGTKRSKASKKDGIKRAKETIRRDRENVNKDNEKNPIAKKS